jgi:Fic family protein
MNRKVGDMAQSYIWQQPGWPRFDFDHAAVGAALPAARREQGKVLGLFRALGLPADTAQVERIIWTEEAMATAAIEGEKLDLAAVRSSVMRRLGVEDPEASRVSRHVDGLLDLMQDATSAFREKLDDDRLMRWQAALFPGGTSGLLRIAVGRYRDHGDPMQIVSGPIGREKVHYEAPASSAVPREMKRFLAWWEKTRPGSRNAPDGIARAAIAHLWFETIHPFEDGNGRVGRAIVDMALAQDIASSQRQFSVSRQLLSVREKYYDELKAAQRGTLDAARWVLFFIEQFRLACVTSQGVVETALEKGRFLASHARHDLNERQRKAMQRLLDAGKGGYAGGMSAEKYANLTGTSKSTATRDLGALQAAGLLVVTGQGKGTRYWPNLPGWVGAG